MIDPYYLSPELHKILHMLAARHGSTFCKIDEGFQWIENIDDIRYKCLICDIEVTHAYESHGIWHLKRSNLLPFI